MNFGLGLCKRHDIQNVTAEVDTNLFGTNITGKGDPPWIMILR